MESLKSDCRAVRDGRSLGRGEEGALVTFIRGQDYRRAHIFISASAQKMIGLLS